MKAVDLEHLRVPRIRKPLRLNKYILRPTSDGPRARGTTKPKQ